MTFLKFMSRIKQVRKGRIRYYYLEYNKTTDDIDKTYSVFLGLTDLEESIVNDHEYIKIKPLDDNNDITNNLYGYSVYVNCNIKVNISYRIYSEGYGNHVIQDINNIHGGLLKSHLKYHNIYDGLRLAKKRLLDEFWRLNKDWLLTIRI